MVAARPCAGQALQPYCVHPAVIAATGGLPSSLTAVDDVRTRLGRLGQDSAAAASRPQPGRAGGFGVGPHFPKSH